MAEDDVADVPDSSPFRSEAYEPDELTLRSFERDGITQPTEVQALSIHLVANGKDVVIQSGTGTGKTLAYLLPLLARVRNEPAFRVLVLAPTPELAMQILRVVENYKGQGVSSLSLIGSGHILRQREKLKKKPRVMVGTPGRVIDLIARKRLSARDLGAVVLDEADQVLSEDNDPLIRDFFSRPEFQAQLIFASATFGPPSEKLVGDFFRSPEFVTCGQEPLKVRIRHIADVVQPNRKNRRLLELLRSYKISRALIFVSRVQILTHLYHFFSEQNFSCSTLGSTRGKHARELAWRRFQSGEVPWLIATDSAARGLDAKDLDWVVHFDAARDVETYLHRCGRTARAGASGGSLSIFTPPEAFLIKRYEKELGIRFETTPAPGADLTSSSNPASNSNPAHPPSSDEVPGEEPARSD